MVIARQPHQRPGNLKQLQQCPRLSVENPRLLRTPAETRSEQSTGRPDAEHIDDFASQDWRTELKQGTPDLPSEQQIESEVYLAWQVWWKEEV